MSRDHLTAEQRGVGAAFLGGRGWGLGTSVVLDGPWAGAIRLGRGLGTSFLVHPERDLAVIVLTQRLFEGPRRPPCTATCRPPPWPPGPVTAGSADAMTPAETVMAFQRAAERRDDSAFGLVAEDLVQHAAGPQGREGLRQTLATLDHDLDRPTATIHRVVAQDDLVVVPPHAARAPRGLDDAAARRAAADRGRRRVGLHPHLAGRGRHHRGALGLPRRRRTPRTGRGLAAVPLIRDMPVRGPARGQPTGTCTGVGAPTAWPRALADRRRSARAMAVVGTEVERGDDRADDGRAGRSTRGELGRSRRAVCGTDRGAEVVRRDRHRDPERGRHPGEADGQRRRAPGWRCAARPGRARRPPRRWARGARDGRQIASSTSVVTDATTTVVACGRTSPRRPPMTVPTSEPTPKPTSTSGTRPTAIPARSVSSGEM